jgi:hypothetical protein
MPEDYVSTFTRLVIDPEMWCKLVWGFKSIFGRSRYAGPPDRIKERNEEQGLAYQPGQKQARKCFA